MKNYNIISILFIIVLLLGCEYDEDKVYFVKHQKPEGEITFNLVNLPLGTTIYIYKETILKYDLGLPNGDILTQKFWLGSEEVISSNGYIMLNPRNYSSKTEEKLTLEIEIDPKSESIAGLLGLENFTGLFEYQIIIIPNADLSLLDIAHHKNGDDYFELTWDKPDLEQYTVEKYKITYYHNQMEYVEEITDPNQTSFIDKDAVFGYLHYRIETFFKESYREPWVDNYTTNIEFARYSVKFEYTGVNSGKIIWPKNEYKSKYALAIGYYGGIIYEGTDNYFEIDDLTKLADNHPLGVFPITYSGEWVELYILPINANTINKDMPKHYDELHGQSLIIRDISYEKYIVSTDTSEDILFILNKDEVWSYNSKTFEMIDNRKISDLMLSNWNTHVFCSEKSSKIFCANLEWIDLISYDLENHEIIQFESSERLFYNTASLGTNDVVFIRVIPNEEEIEGALCAYDLNSRSLISKLTVENKWDTIIVSRDGKYICTYNVERALVYEFTGSVFSLIYTEQFPVYGQGNYAPRSISFNQKESKQLIISSYPDEMYTINMETGAKSGNKRYSYICSDPYSGNIVGQRGGYIVVVSISLDEELLSLKESGTDWLINNRFMKGGWGDQNHLYYLDITNHLRI